MDSRGQITIRPGNGPTCSLDVADTEREHSVDEIAQILGLSRQTVNSILNRGLIKLKKAMNQ